MNKLCMMLLLSAIVMGCSGGPSVDKEEASREIDRLYQRFAVAYDSLDTEMVAKLYAEDGFYLVPNPKRAILKGRSSIKDSFAGFMEGAAANNRDIEISFRIIERKISDSLAFDVGYYRTRSKPDSLAEFGGGGSVGKFVTVMGLLPEGEWKFLLDGYNPAPVAAFSDSEAMHNPLVSN